MNVVFAGSPEFAVRPLKSLIESGVANVIAAVTQRDKPVGRKKTLTPTPVKQFALAAGLPVYDFDKIRNHVPELAALGADIMITCAYGQILTQEVLNCFPLGVWNLHASLLPKFRGASPIQSAILAGEKYTGITVMKTELSLDSGDILLVKRCETGQKTCGQLTEELSVLAAESAVETVEMLKKGNLQLLVQDESLVSFCKKIEKEDCKLNFGLPAERVLHAVKAFSPQPAAFCNLRGTPLNILDAMPADADGKPGEVVACDKRGVTVACGTGGILVTMLQHAGGKVMPARDFANGRKIAVGDVLE